MIRVLLLMVFFSSPLKASSQNLERKGGNTFSRFVESLHPWEKFTRGFRGNHHLVIDGGVTHGLWDIAVDDFTVEEIKSAAGVGLISYEFHLQLGAGMGYYLGSSLGLMVQRDRLDGGRLAAVRNVGFERQILLPGGSAGLVLNVNPVWRIGLGLDFFLERLEGISALKGSARVGGRSVTGRGWGWGIAIDWFYNLQWGLRMSYRWRSIGFNSEQFTYQRWENWTTLGLVKHFL